MEYFAGQGLLKMLQLLPSGLFVFWIFLRVFRKAGWSGWWVVLLALPFVNILLLWVFSFMRWPGLDKAQAKRATDIFS